MTEQKFNELQDSVASKFASLITEVSNKNVGKILLILEEDNSREIFFREFYSRLTEEERFFVVYKNFMEAIVKTLERMKNKLT